MGGIRSRLADRTADSTWRGVHKPWAASSRGADERIRLAFRNQRRLLHRDDLESLLEIGMPFASGVKLRRDRHDVARAICGRAPEPPHRSRHLSGEVNALDRIPPLRAIADDPYYRVLIR